GVVAVQSVDGELVARFRVLDRHERLEAGDCDGRRVSGDVDRVGAVRPLHHHLVDRVVAQAAAGGIALVDVDPGDVGAAQVVDGDQVGRAEGVEVDLLDIVGVHRDVADV